MMDWRFLAEFCRKDFRRLLALAFSFAFAFGFAFGARKLQRQVLRLRDLTCAQFAEVCLAGFRAAASKAASNSMQS